MTSRLAAAAILAAATLAAAPGAARDQGRSFVDGFDGPRLDRRLWDISNGWSNGPWHGCAWSSENVRKREDRIELTLDDRRRADRAFSCAELQSRALHHHGTYEVRLRAAAGDGVVTTFFVHTGPHAGDPHHEIDLHFPGARPASVELGAWVDGVPFPEGPTALSFDASLEVRDYAFEWRPDRLRWFVDGALVREVTDPARIPDRPGRIHLSVYNGTEELEGWLGPFRYPDRPIRVEVDRIAFTALGEACQFEGSVACAPTQ